MFGMNVANIVHFETLLLVAVTMLVDTYSYTLFGSLLGMCYSSPTGIINSIFFVVDVLCSRFAELVAGILLHKGFKVYLFSTYTPTPFNVCLWHCVCVCSYVLLIVYMHYECHAEHVSQFIN